MKRFRLIRTPAAGASFNMALDEVILSSLLSDGIATLRTYQWENPSFSIGISQDPRDTLDLKRCQADGVAFVRRMTGGGILFHDDEVTYSFACMKEAVGEPRDVLVSYRDICGFLILFYRKLGLCASFACQGNDFARKSAPHDLCSASFEKYDLLINAKKIGGNAQKRARNAIFQHGSIPVSIDWDRAGRYIPGRCPELDDEVTTLVKELSKIPGRSFLEETLISSFAEYFDVRFFEEGLTRKEETLLRRLEEEKYGNPRWNIEKDRPAQACLA